MRLESLPEDGVHLVLSERNLAELKRMWDSRIGDEFAVLFKRMPDDRMLQVSVERDDLHYSKRGRAGRVEEWSPNGALTP